ncbi:olfactory receptor 5AP2-like [Gastrophryne carolinensis]
MATYVAVKIANQTFVEKFFLLRLSEVFALKLLSSLLLLLAYLTTLSGNVLLIMSVKLTPRLQTPMYFFLSNLSLIDVCFTSTVVPKILVNTMSLDRSISFFGCATQFYFHMALGATECVLLAVMAFDRYNAICKPLQYHTIMNQKLCFYMAIGCWLTGFVNSIVLTTMTFELNFCKSTQINHFFCEMPPLLQLSCTDIWFCEVMEYFYTVLAAFGTFLLILISYFFILLAILKLSSSEQRQKAFSTCASHLAVVCLFYGNVLYMHLRPPFSYNPEQDKVVSIFYTIVAPVLNPIIYSIRNKEIKLAIQKLVIP